MKWKKARRILLRRLVQSPERVAEIALQFVRRETGEDLNQCTLTPPTQPGADWRVIYERSKPGVDPSVIIVLVSDETGVARFFPVL